MMSKQSAADAFDFACYDAIAAIGEPASQGESPRHCNDDPRK
jgi:hypothetical protein